MKKCDSSFLYFNFLLIFLNYLIKYINCQINLIYPETYKDDDLFFFNIENEERIYFVAAKYFKDNNINTYIKKQGFNLQKYT